MTKGFLKRKRDAFLFSFISLFLFIGSTALAQEAPPLPPDFDPNTEGTPVDMSQSIELTPVLPPGSVSQEEAQAIEQQTQASEGEVTEVDFQTLFQETKDLPGAPEILQTIQTEEELSALPQEEQEEVQTFIQNLFSPGDLVSAPEDIPGTTSCFEHYQFGSVQTNVYDRDGRTAFWAGTTQILTVSILNENPFPS